MPETHSIATPTSDAPPRLRSVLPQDTWLPLAEVAALVAASSAAWPARPGPRGKRREAVRG
jgi:hypothetical protein